MSTARPLSETEVDTDVDRGADWDADSTRLSKNLAVVMSSAERHAARREAVTLDLLKQWHARTMLGLRLPDAHYVGQFRGPPHLIGIGVRVGEHVGVSSAHVQRHLEGFITVLGNMLQQLDAAAPHIAELDLDGFQAAVEVAAWAHSQWARIHPFVNGNGRIARVLANTILMRYGVRPALRLRPRPGDGYADACAAAMSGDWGDHLPMTAYLHELLRAGS